MLSKKLRVKIKVNNAESANKIMKKMVLDQDREHFIVLSLNARNVPTGVHIISIGTLNASLVHPREVFTKVIKDKAASFIIAHNHPSGGMEPSNADIQLNHRLKDAGKLMGVELVDSLVMDRKGNYNSIIDN